MNLVWGNRYAMTMYEKRPTRWRDMPRRRDDVFLPLLTPWQEGDRKGAGGAGRGGDRKAAAGRPGGGHPPPDGGRGRRGRDLPQPFRDLPAQAPPRERAA